MAKIRAYPRAWLSMGVSGGTGRQPRTKQFAADLRAMVGAEE
jgi:hypothetical protein